MKNKLSKHKIFADIIFAFCSAFGVCIDFNAEQISNTYSGTFAGLSMFLKRFSSALSGKEIMFTVVTAFFAFLYCYLDKKIVNKDVILVRLWSVILSITQVIGFSFYYTGGWSLAFSDGFQIFKTVIMLIGFYFIYFYVIHLLYYVVNNSSFKKPNGKVSYFLFEKKPVLIITLLMIIERIPIILSSYPVRLIYDNCWEIDEYKFNWLNDHHTVFHTLVINWFGQLGEKLGNQGTGFFIYLVLQLIFTSLIVGYCFEIMHKLQTPIWSRWFMFLLFFATSYCLSYSSFMEKDIPFSYCALLIVAEMILCVVDYKKFFASKKDIIISIFAITMFCLVRKNGLYITGVLLLIIVGFFIVKCIKEKKLCVKNFAKTVAIFLIPIVLMSSFNNVFIKAYDMSTGDTKETLSLLFMQTARYAAEHDKEVTDEEREIIDSVLNYEKIKYDYSIPTDINASPYKDNTCYADYIKNTYRGDDSKLPQYFKTWFSMFLKHPETYIQATWAMGYSIASYDDFSYSTAYSPESYVADYNDPENAEAKMNEIKQYTEPEWTASTKAMAEELFVFMSKFPGLNLLNDYTTYTVLSAIFLLFIFNDLKNKKYNKARFILPLLLVLFSIVINILGPCMIPRYFFPAMFSIPLIYGAYSSNAVKKLTVQK